MTYDDFLRRYYRVLAVVLSTIFFGIAIIATIICLIAILDILLSLGFGYPLWVVPLLLFVVCCSTLAAILALRAKRRF